jgi:hypothetical protein
VGSPRSTPTARQGETHFWGVSPAPSPLIPFATMAPKSSEKKPAGARKASGKKAVSRSAKAGLQFPVG